MNFKIAARGFHRVKLMAVLCLWTAALPGAATTSAQSHTDCYASPPSPVSRFTGYWKGYVKPGEAVFGRILANSKHGIHGGEIKWLAESSQELKGIRVSGERTMFSTGKGKNVKEYAAELRGQSLLLTRMSDQDTAPVTVTMERIGNFEGVWSSEEGKKGPTIRFRARQKQNEDRVRGTITFHNVGKNGTKTITAKIDGRVDGNTLRFEIQKPEPIEYVVQIGCGPIADGRAPNVYGKCLVFTGSRKAVASSLSLSSQSKYTPIPTSFTLPFEGEYYDYHYFPIEQR